MFFIFLDNYNKSNFMNNSIKVVKIIFHTLDYYRKFSELSLKKIMIFFIKYGIVII